MTVRVRKDSIIGRPRKEKGSFYLITPKVYTKPHFVNSYIFNLWKQSDGKDINTIITEYIEKYPNVDKEKIKADVLNSIVYLNNLKMIDIIDEEEVMKNMRDNGISLVNEGDFRSISEFIQDSYTSNTGIVISFEYEGLLDINSIKDVYSIQMMRLNQIHGNELYFKICDEMKNIKSVVGIKLLNNTKSCYLNTIVIGKEVSLNLNEVVIQVIEYLKTHSMENFKIKTSNAETVKNFLKIGFNVEAEINDELENKKTLYIIRRG